MNKKTYEVDVLQIFLFTFLFTAYLNDMETNSLTMSTVPLKFHNNVNNVII